MENPTIAALAVVSASALALAGCSPQSTPESVALDFASAMFANSGKLPSEFLCGASTMFDDDRWFEPATDLALGEIEDVDSSGHQRVWVTYLRPSGAEDRVITTVDVRDLCVAAVQ